jgi:hypothetical protein
VSDTHFSLASDPQGTFIESTTKQSVSDIPSERGDSDQQSSYASRCRLRRGCTLGFQFVTISEFLVAPNRTV